MLATCLKNTTNIPSSTRKQQVEEHLYSTSSALQHPLPNILPNDTSFKPPSGVVQCSYSFRSIDEQVPILGHCTSSRLWWSHHRCNAWKRFIITQTLRAGKQMPIRFLISRCVDASIIFQLGRIVGFLVCPANA